MYLFVWELLTQRKVKGLAVVWMERPEEWVTCINGLFKMRLRYLSF